MMGKIARMLEDDAMQCQGLAEEAGADELVAWIARSVLPTIWAEEDIELASEMTDEAWAWLECERMWRA